MSEESQGILRSSAVMAAGTVFSRLSGFLRAALLTAALGQQLHGDVFNIANTIPNMLYILLAGGIFNAVLVPQLVRAMKTDPDGGAAYTNRVVTLAALFLGLVSVALVALAPWVMQLFLSNDWADLPEQTASVVAFARYCLPQVFFYGMFVLLGQILNARGSFGPMMWAPIANNVVSIAVLVSYLLVYGPASDLCGGFSSGQELLLGLGSTVGIAVQLLVLIPYLKAAGFTFRPRFDFRDAGLGHTLRLGLWTVLFVVVNQIAYTVVVRLASSGTAQAALDSCGSGGTQGTGYTVYSQSFLIVMVPHAVVTVSLATAILPRLSSSASDGDLRALAQTLAHTLRTALAVILPFAGLLAVIAPDVANLIFNHGAGAPNFALYAPTLTLFGFALVFFTVHYLMLRGFYALERTRTVFFIQCGVAATNILAAWLLVRGVSPEGTSPALVVAYAASYAVGSALSYLVLRRVVGGLGGRGLLRFAVRAVVAVAGATAIAAVVSWLLHGWLGGSPAWPVATAILLAAGGLGGLAYLLLARLLRLTEVTEVLDTLGGRLWRRRTG
ncbi:murein biosynthesis integral membrane protein MurJ [Nocardioides sp.]|uniref:murein biosynthesis integral membrane protein MurJ n=1 Tax=Nocardioides sp. TaxID=35761 RepID=UPI0035293B3E